MSGQGPFDPYEDPEFAELLARALAAQEDGHSDPVGSVCQSRPDLLEAIDNALGTGRRLRLLEEASAAHDQYAGRTLSDRYELLERIGAGAMGVVYRSLDHELDRAVAVKILRPLLLHGDEAASRFEREARALARLQHPNVVPVHDRGHTREGDSYLVMELLVGESLQNILDRAERSGQSVNRRDLVRWIQQVGSGLTAAHASGLLHRDLKPSNIFVRENGDAVLIDFGIAASLEEARITADQGALGTPAFLAPEALHAGHSSGPSVDIYGLTATLYRGLGGVDPYTGTPSGVISQLSVQDPTPLARLSDGIPRDLIAIVGRGMARDVRDRYASATELTGDLASFLDHRPVKARPLPLWLRSLRRFQRSIPLQAAVAVGAAAVLISLALVINQELDARASRRAFAARASVPANLCIVGPGNRRASSPGEASLTRAALDKWVANAAWPIPSRVIRSAFRHDQGEHAAAHEDLLAVAHATGSAYAADLAQRYFETSDSSLIDLNGLPEPTSTDERYLAAFHTLRASDHASAAEQLRSEELADVPHAQELAIIFEMGTPELAYEHALKLEGQLGGRTAQTAHLVGAALSVLKKYESAAEIYFEAIRLSPQSYVLHENAAYACYKAEWFQLAEDSFDRAIELRPKHAKPHLNRIRMRAGRGQFEAARETLARWRELDSALPMSKSLSIEGDIDSMRAVGAWLAGDVEVSTASVEQALVNYERAHELNTDLKASYWEDLARALAQEDHQHVADHLLDRATAFPFNETEVTYALQFSDQPGVHVDPARLLRLLEAIHKELGVRALKSEKRIRARFPRAVSPGQRPN